MNVMFELPWPPTVNTYWRRRGAVYFISKKGIEYKSSVKNICANLSGLFHERDRISVKVNAFPPDGRRRDLDNIFKSLLDSLQAAKIYADDCQIDKLYIERMPERLSKIIVNIEKIN